MPTDREPLQFPAKARTDRFWLTRDELIDMVSIVGPKDRVRARLRDFRDAGVDTLIVWPVMPDQDVRKEQLRLIAELNE